ncbi:hypothetical protein BCR35DRAFT_329992 [Leucosporidium creatinivorum]|uniref:G-protein coupled receptors family 1 profile domain-containing protein n=1 Tax=Leucosporidium creatinivorum TaxID=106004 RepID=A0A1Y2FWP0_9BASI|nr:hypothetical protein BCR35DRAFT_329992 [Leucosporidium creatinivorum]
MATSFGDQQGMAQGWVLAFFLVALSSVAVMAAKRTPSLAAVRYMKWMRFVILWHLSISFLAILGVTLWIFGIGTMGAHCRQTFFLFVCLFASTKMPLHLFLAERVHLVYTADIRRLWAWPYWCFSVIMAAATVIIVFCFLQRNSHIDADGVCNIGYSHALSWGLIGGLFATEGGATLAFVLPIWRSSFSNARTLARRSTISSTAALLSSFANYLYLPLVGGSVQAWIYAACVVGDITFNAYIMYFLTTPASSSPAPSRPPLSPTVGEASLPLHLALESSPFGSPNDKNKTVSSPLTLQSMLEAGAEEQHMVELRRESAPRRAEWEGQQAV